MAIIGDPSCGVSVAAVMWSLRRVGAGMSAASL